MKCAILQITPEALSALLQLPEGAEVVAVHHSDRRGVFELRIHGAGWETLPGDAIPRATGIVRREILLDDVSPPEKISINWGFPAEDKRPG